MAAPEATSDTAPTTNAPNIGQQTYARNGIYYNPATTYTPWSDYLGTGNYVADVTYNAAYSSLYFGFNGKWNHQLKQFCSNLLCAEKPHK